MSRIQRPGQLCLLPTRTFVFVCVAENVASPNVARHEKQTFRDWRKSEASPETQRLLRPTPLSRSIRCQTARRPPAVVRSRRSLLPWRGPGANGGAGGRRCTPGIDDADRDRRGPRARPLRHDPSLLERPQAAPPAALMPID